jgi:hypothetical protein
MSFAAPDILLHDHTLTLRHCAHKPQEQSTCCLVISTSKIDDATPLTELIDLHTDPSSSIDEASPSQ